MIGLLLAVVLSVVNGGTDWRAQFSAHPLNVGIAMSLRCYTGTKLVWESQSYMNIEGDWTDAIIHRETRGIPKGAECTQTFAIQRNSDGAQGDAAKDYDAPGESARITWRE